MVERSYYTAIFTNFSVCVCVQCVNAYESSCCVFSNWFLFLHLVNLRDRMSLFICNVERSAVILPLNASVPIDENRAMFFIGSIPQRMV